MGIDYQDGNDVFMSADSERAPMPGAGRQLSTCPQTRSRSAGLAVTATAKFFVTLLGHNGLSFETPEFQRTVLNGVSWAGG